ncbi:MAG: hypothetical protein HC927_12105 [Deltaproteobacteria bacterium]|nr:hypothetical protein [Deltaproteobacteria bacterium]
MDDGEVDMRELIARIPPGLLERSEVAHIDLLEGVLAELAGPDHRWSAVELRDRANALRSIAQLGTVIRQGWALGGMSAERYAAIIADLVVDGCARRARKERQNDPHVSS